MRAQDRCRQVGRDLALQHAETSQEFTVLNAAGDGVNFITPMLTIAVMVPLTLLTTGPASDWAGQGASGLIA